MHNFIREKEEKMVIKTSICQQFIQIAETLYFQNFNIVYILFEICTYPYCSRTNIIHRANIALKYFGTNCSVMMWKVETFSGKKILFAKPDDGKTINRSLR